MSAITTHILNTSRGRPAAGVKIVLWQLSEEKGWTRCAERTTDEDGRVSDFLPSGRPAEAATYRLRFEVGGYFQGLGETAFYPFIDIVFEITATDEHYHVPLLLNPFGYSTYRGS